jgi:hypothetical protein
MSSQNTYETEAGETECECGCCGFIAGMETAIDGRVWLGCCDKCGKEDFCSDCAQMNDEGECVCRECAEKD